jgi:tetratricopeptide (TPR) repeat protein
LDFLWTFTYNKNGDGPGGTAPNQEKVNMSIKTSVLNLVQAGHDHVLAFVAGLDDDARTATGSADFWSARDHLAHIVTWQLHHLEPPPGETERALTFQDVGAINADIFAKHRAQPWADVLADLQRGYDLQTAYLNTVDEAGLLANIADPGQPYRPAWRIIVANHYTHALMHLAQFHFDRQQPDQGLEYYRLMVDPLLTLDDSAEWQALTRYNQACLYALAGSPQQAITVLREALIRAPDLIPWSREDPDLDSLRTEPAYVTLMAEVDQTPSPSQE